jgi:hypothetical protein
MSCGREISDRMSKLKFSPSRRKLLQATVLVPVAVNTAVAGQAAKTTSGRYFTVTEFEFVQELAETIIPADDHSGGAKAAGVAHYIDQVLRDTVDSDQKLLWKNGMRLVNALSRRQCGKSFVKAGSESRVRVLEVLSMHGEMTDLAEIRFFHDLKRLVVLGYYTSKIGILDDLEYKGNKIQMEFSGCDTENSELDGF